MYKITGGDGKHYGPVSAEVLRRWIAEGRLNSRSQVQAEGSPDWKALADFPEFADALAAQGSGGTAAAPSVPPVSPAAWTAEVLARQPHLDIGQCLSRSWNLLTANFGLLFGASALIWLVSLCQFIPIVGLIYKIVAGAFYGGLYLVFLKRIRGQPASVGDAFSGLQIAFAQLLLAGFISGLLAGLGTLFCLLPGLYLFVAWALCLPLVIDRRLEFWAAMELSRKVVSRVWFQMLALLLLAFLPTVVVAVFTVIKVTLVALATVGDTMRAGAPDVAHLMAQIKQVVNVSLKLAFVKQFVLLINLPFATGALMYAYENLFGARTSPAAQPTDGLGMPH
jgi:hypothetical protein